MCPLLRQPENTAAVVFDGMGQSGKGVFRLPQLVAMFPLFGLKTIAVVVVNNIGDFVKQINLVGIFNFAVAGVQHILFDWRACVGEGFGVFAVLRVVAFYIGDDLAHILFGGVNIISVDGKTRRQPNQPRCADDFMPSPVCRLPQHPYRLDNPPQHCKWGGDKH